MVQGAENDTATLRKVETWWRSEKDKDRHDLELWLASHGATINDTKDGWIRSPSPAAGAGWMWTTRRIGSPRHDMVIAKDSVKYLLRGRSWSTA